MKGTGKQYLQLMQRKTFIVYKKISVTAQMQFLLNGKHLIYLFETESDDFV